MKIIMSFGERLTELMQEKGLTIEQLGSAVGISGGTISNWKTGKQNISLSNAIKLAIYFRCSLEFLIGRTDKRMDYHPQDYTSFYTRLMAVMREKGRSRYRIVRETKLSDGNFYSWKNGSDPYLQSIIDLADYLGCTIDYLAGLEK